MPYVPIFEARVVNNQLKFTTPGADAYLASMNNEVVEVCVFRRRRTRSIRANDYYWGVVVETLVEKLGWWKNDIHEWLKAKFLPGNLTSTTDCSQEEFSRYLENCACWAATEAEVYIPPPDKVVKI